MKKLLVSLLCVVMITTFMPTMAFADNAEAGEVPQENASVMLQRSGEENSARYYGSINMAIKAAGEYNSTSNKKQYIITLIEDLQEDVIIPPNMYLKIDLAGHTLTNVDSHTIYNKSKNITIIDNSGDGSGTVDNVSNGKAAIYNDINTKITISGGNYTRSKESSKSETDGGGNSWYVIKNFGAMTINKGKVKFSDTNSGLYSSLIGNGWQNGAKAESGENGEPKPSAGNKTATLTISGGTFTGGQITVKNDDYGELTIKGGEIKQNNPNRAAVANNNKATISGGTIETTGTGEKSVAVYSRYFEGGMNSGSLTISGGTFKSTGTVIQPENGSKLTITNGTFETTGDNSYIINVKGTLTSDSSVKNGTYTGADINKIANNNNVFAKGYAPLPGSDGEITVGVTDEGAEAIVILQDNTEIKYVTLGEAMAGAQPGSTVKLQKDAILDKSANASGYGLTVDLNGHNIDGSNVSSSIGVLKLYVSSNASSTKDDISMKIINSQQTGGEIKGTIPLEVSGHSNIPVEVVVDSNVKLNVIGEGNAIEMSKSAYLAYNEQNMQYLKNGTFKIKNNGEEQVYGSYPYAAKFLQIKLLYCFMIIKALSKLMATIQAL